MTDFSQSRFYAQLPFKSVGMALILSVVLGPIGLLYASYWGGIAMIFITFVILCNKFTLPVVLAWLICCVWAVGATNRYNKKLILAKK